MEITPVEILKNRKALTIFFLFLVILGWRIALVFNPSDSLLYWWGVCYQTVALYGAIAGFILASKWGGFKSSMGKTTLIFAFGLLLQSFGQAVSSWFVYTTGTVPYPSIGDIGFFGSVIFYIIGVFFLAQVSSVHTVFKSILHKAQAIIFPLAMLCLSYFFFLKDYQVDWSDKVKVFLDFGYPLGQAFYVSVAILLIFATRKMWGGAMKKPMMFLLVALIAQYASDFTFLYQSNNNTYVGGGLVDMMYFVAYSLMAFSLVYLGNVFYKIQSENLTQGAVRPELEASTTDKLLNQIVVEIIKRQERIAGQVAWEQARKVEGLNVVDRAQFIVVLNGDPKKIIDSLVQAYASVFGSLAAEVSRSAARYLVAELPADQVPESVK